MIEIIHGDAIAFVAATDMRAFDAQITDPPYRPHVHRNAISVSGPRGTTQRDLGFAYLTPALRHAIARAAGAVRGWSVIHTDRESTWLWRHAVQAAKGEYIRTVPWVRWSMPQTSADRPTTGAEDIMLFYGAKAGRKQWHGPGNLTHLERTELEAVSPDAYDAKALRGEEKHKAQKPLDLVLDLVSYHTDPRDVVFEPCSGAGTTALACKLLGRSCVALELDESWAARSAARVGSSELSASDAIAVERFTARCAARHAYWRDVRSLQPNVSENEWRRHMRWLDSIAPITVPEIRYGRP